MRTLKIGMAGEDVREAQRALVEAGAQIKVDGMLGAMTSAAVRIFQADHDLEADGIIGPLTWCYLGAGSTCAGPLLLGCDVSESNGRQPWKAHHDAGVRFAMVRVTSGRRRDDRAERHLAELLVTGLDIAPGCYGYLSGSSPGEEQAGAFLAAVEPIERAAGPCVLAVDVEHRNPPAPRWPRDLYRRTLEDFLGVVHAQDREVIFYGNRSIVEELGLDGSFATIPLWAVDLAPPLEAYGPWRSTGWTMCQFRFGDAHGAIDLDRFRGTAEDFTRLAGLRSG